MARKPTRQFGLNWMQIIDLENEILRIDSLVFTPDKHRPARVAWMNTIPDGFIPGTHIGKIASFQGADNRRAQDKKIVAISQLEDQYLLWLHHIEHKIFSLQNSGHGESDIKKFWLLSAIGLVRSRILFHAGMFSNVRTRTVLSLKKKFGAMFGTQIFVEFHEFNKINEGVFLTPAELDTRLTQFLIATAVQHAHTNIDKLIVRLLIAD